MNSRKSSPEANSASTPSYSVIDLEVERFILLFPDGHDFRNMLSTYESLKGLAPKGRLSPLDDLSVLQGKMKLAQRYLRNPSLVALLAKNPQIEDAFQNFLNIDTSREDRELEVNLFSLKNRLYAIFLKSLSIAINRYFYSIGYFKAAISVKMDSILAYGGGEQGGKSDLEASAEFLLPHELRLYREFILYLLRDGRSTHISDQEKAEKIYGFLMGLLNVGTFRTFMLNRISKQPYTPRTYDLRELMRISREILYDFHATKVGKWYLEICNFQDELLFHQK